MLLEIHCLRLPKFRRKLRVLQTSFNNSRFQCFDDEETLKECSPVIGPVVGTLVNIFFFVSWMLLTMIGLGPNLCELLSRLTPEGPSTRMIELLTLAAELTWTLRGRVWRASSRRAHHGLRRSRPPRTARQLLTRRLPGPVSH